jgi:hypothetical protein
MSILIDMPSKYYISMQPASRLRVQLGWPPLTAGRQDTDGRREGTHCEEPDYDAQSAVYYGTTVSNSKGKYVIVLVHYVRKACRRIKVKVHALLTSAADEVNSCRQSTFPCRDTWDNFTHETQYVWWIVKRHGLYRPPARRGRTAGGLVAATLAGAAAATKRSLLKLGIEPRKSNPHSIADRTIPNITDDETVTKLK